MLHRFFSLVVFLVTTCLSCSFHFGRKIASHGNTSVRQLASNTEQTNAIPPLCTEPPLKILLLVEPTPFNYVSGYANRFKEMLKFLRTAGDEVRVLTADKDPKPPTNFLGYPITTNRGFEFILYNQITLTFDLKKEAENLIKDFKPDIIHVSSPSCIIWPAIIWSRVYNIPLVMSYHTNFAEYSRTYGGFPGAVYLSYKVLRFFHNQADLTLCTSPQLADDLESCGVRRVDVWQKGINAEVPSFQLRINIVFLDCYYFSVDSPIYYVPYLLLLHRYHYFSYTTPFPFCSSITEIFSLFQE